MIAAQKDLEFMYIMSPNVYLEILDDNGNVVPDGLMGNVVVTSLVAKSMPLIRYKIGDLAIKLPKSEYPVKRDLQLPLLKKVIGRDTDIVKTPSGKFMVVHTFTGIFEHFTEIEQFCIVQHNIESIEILYIPREIFKISILHSIEDLIQKYLEEPSFKIFFKEVECIPPTPSGKPQIIISNISK
jgi:phenylacetate-CoA ligase